MNGRKESPDAWEVCCQGELLEMVDRMRTVRRRRFLKQASLAALALVGMGAGISFAVYRGRISGDYRYGDYRYGGSLVPR